MRPLLIYIHGFKSSPLSQKAQEVDAYLQSHGVPVEFVAPAMSDYPGTAYRQLQHLVESERERGREQIAVIGSSLGGFMATGLVERMGLKGVLINPAVRPSRFVEHVLGENENPYSGQRFVLTQEHADELRSLEVQPLTACDRLMVLLQTGDETLNYRAAQKYYSDCTLVVEEGGDHRFQNFERHIPKVLTFLDLL